MKPGRNGSITDQPVGPYRLLAHLGSGGMGDVYLAEDSRLRRKVALKVLPLAVTTDAERVRRFQQEARAASALNHPNVITIHEIGEAAGRHFIATEYVEGETLRQRLSKGGLSLKEALAVAAQVASGLAAAHHAGIVHRDVKPENIMLRRDGHVKLLDFGLAKLFDSAAGAASSDAATRTELLTDAGTVMGTVGYMSPEQVRGLPVDHRSDIFAFGAVLFEMLSRRRAFQGDSSVEVLHAILNDEVPDLSQDQRVSPALGRLVCHCLEKVPERRFQSVRDLEFDLETLAATTSPTSSASPRGARVAMIRWLGWIAAGVLLLALFTTRGVWFDHARDLPSDGKALRFPIAMPEKTSFAGYMSVSPDGQRIALRGSNAAGQFMYFVRALDSSDARPLPGTEGGEWCFWSPDSRSLAFLAGGKLQKLDLSGGLPQTISAKAAGGSGAWSRAGIILLSYRQQSLFRLSDSGGELQLVRAPDKSRGERALVHPSFLPDGRHFLYFALNENPAASGGYVGSLDSPETTRLVTTDMAPAYAAGYLLFVQQGRLLAQPFNPTALELTGEPVEVAREVMTGIAYSYAPYSVSENGVLAYQSKSPLETQLTWLDRNGNELERVGSPGVISEPVLSRDQKFVVFARRDVQFKRDLWLLNLERGGEASRLTSDQYDNTQPVWGPGDTSVIFDKRLGNGTAHLYEKAIGGGPERPILDTATLKFAEDSSRDGRYVLFLQFDPVTRSDEWILPRFGEGKATPYLSSRFAEYGAVFHPGGKWVAYTSDEAGRPDIHVRSFPEAAREGTISNRGGAEPRWRGDGRELCYIARDQKLMAVEVNATATTLTASVPQVLFDTDVAPARDMRNHYDVSVDGRRFLFAMPTHRGSSATVNVVVNWTASLKK